MVVGPDTLLAVQAPQQECQEEQEPQAEKALTFACPRKGAHPRAV